MVVYTTGGINRFLVTTIKKGWNSMSKMKRDDYDLVAIGQRMKLVRARLRKTQALMAQDLGVSLSHYSKLEVGIGGMSHGLVYTFCRLFGVDQDWFCYGQGDDPVDLIDPAVAEEAAKGQKANEKITDENLEKIIELAQNEATNKLADQIASATQIPKVRALAILIREKLQAEAKESAEKKN